MEAVLGYVAGTALCVAMLAGLWHFFRSMSPHERRLTGRFLAIGIGFAIISAIGAGSVEPIDVVVWPLFGAGAAFGFWMCYRAGAMVRQVLDEVARRL